MTSQTDVSINYASNKGVSSNVIFARVDKGSSKYQGKYMSALFPSNKQLASAVFALLVWQSLLAPLFTIDLFVAHPKHAMSTENVIVYPYIVFITFVNALQRLCFL